MISNELFYQDYLAVTPSNTANLNLSGTTGSLPKAFFIGGTGNLVVQPANTSQANVTFAGLATGQIIKIRALKVLTTSTATNIVALY